MRQLAMTVRSLARQPGVTVPAVLTLALGIGANTALFAYLAAVLWPQVAAPEPERVVWVYTGTPEEPLQQTPLPDYLDIRRAPTGIADLNAWSPCGLSVNLGEQTTYAWGQLVSGGYFSFFGARPAAGRLLQPADDRPEAPPVAVLSYAFWKGTLGADPGALGRVLRMNGQTVTVVGVAPDRFTGPGLPAAVYLPLAQADRVTGVPRSANREVRWVSMGGRLAPGARIEPARAVLDGLARSLDESAPVAEGERRFTVAFAGRYMSPSGGKDPYFDSARLLSAAAGLFLLLGCASIANLLLARATARQREWAIRASLGAGRLRLAAGLLLESLVLCLAGALAGLPFAMLLARRIDSYVATPPPGLGNWGEGTNLVGIDGRALTFALAVALLCTLLGGLGPVFRLTRRDLLDPLKSDAAGSGTAAGTLGVRKLLVVAQVASSVLLLLGGGLLWRSLDGAQHIDPGFSPDRLLLASIYVPRSVGGAAGSAPLFTRIRDEVGEIPGVRAATLALMAPLTGMSRGTQVAPRERPDASIPSSYNLVGMDYFSTLGIPIVQGRALDRRDQRDAAPAVVVNETLARKLWGDGGAVGRFVTVTEPPRPGEPGPDFEVVGVARDVRSTSPVDPPGPLLYFSQEQRSHSRMTIVARTTAPPLALAPALRRALRTASPDLAVIDLMTCRESLARVLVLPRMYAEIAGLFGLLGLAVAVVGVFGLLSYTVSLRRREMGIRMAVGARPADVRRLVLRQGMALVGAGLAAGVAGALALSHALAGILYGVGATDPLTFAAVPAALALVALLACDLPARRAARVEPSATLR
jgi:predicted permease